MYHIDIISFLPHQAVGGVEELVVRPWGLVFTFRCHGDEDVAGWHVALLRQGQVAAVASPHALRRFLGAVQHGLQVLPHPALAGGAMVSGALKGEEICRWAPKGYSVPLQRLGRWSGVRMRHARHQEPRVVPGPPPPIRAREHEVAALQQRDEQPVGLVIPILKDRRHASKASEALVAA